MEKKTMENVGKRVRVEFLRKDEGDKVFKQQSKLTITGIHRSQTNYEGYTSKQKEVFMDQLLYPRIAVIELFKLSLRAR